MDYQKMARVLWGLLLVSIGVNLYAFFLFNKILNHLLQ